MEEIWIEKYRPKILDDVVGQSEIVERLKSYVKTKNVPHLMFAGPAGTGKTTCALAMAKELFDPSYHLHADHDPFYLVYIFYHR